MSICTCKSLGTKLDIRLPRYAPDERVAFVESVCRSLIESRFGPYRQYEMFVNLARVPQPDDCVFLDVTPGGLSPSYDYARIPDAVLDRVEEAAGIDCRAATMKPIVPNATSARGSPRQKSRP
jgi:hypothetical protein